METSRKADDSPGPAKRPQCTPQRGAPPTYATRKDVNVRVSVTTPTTESEELREHGYGHGV